MKEGKFNSEDDSTKIDIVFFNSLLIIYGIGVLFSDLRLLEDLRGLDFSDLVIELVNVIIVLYIHVPHLLFCCVPSHLQVSFLIRTISSCIYLLFQEILAKVMVFFQLLVVDSLLML